MTEPRKFPLRVNPDYLVFIVQEIQCPNEITPHLFSALEQLAAVFPDLRLSDATDLIANRARFSIKNQELQITLIDKP